jgi:uncharacterized protein YjbI with pentapeptide repeats
VAVSYDKKWQLATLRESVSIWNLWRKEYPKIPIDLGGVDLSGSDLTEADLSGANLPGTNLTGANLNWTQLSHAGLRQAQLRGALLLHADLRESDLSDADLREAEMWDVNLSGARLVGANLSHALLGSGNLRRADLREANLRATNLIKTDLSEANLSQADLSGADFLGADLSGSICRQTDFSRAKLRQCRIYDMALADARLNGTTQQVLCITPRDQPQVAVDDLQVAQSLSRLLRNDEIHDILRTSQVVVLVGDFAFARPSALGALCDSLRTHGYLPVVFDFARSSDQCRTETLARLARIARFIIADLTMPSSLPQDLDAILPTTMVPVQPVAGLMLGQKPWAQYKDTWKYDWVLSVYRYDSRYWGLLDSLPESLILRAEAKVEELRSR